MSPTAIPRSKIRRKSSFRALFCGGALFAAGFLPVARAQYVGHVDANQDNNAPTLRATAVLEYTGDVTKPNASRLIPVAVWDGERYEPGALYLAQPVPLTVQSGTQYVLQVAGTPKGLYDVNAASDATGSWIAIGTYQKQASPTIAKLRPSRHLPRIVETGGDDKPHFAHVPAGDTNPGSPNTTNTSQTSAQSSAPADPDRPTLHKRTADDSSSQSTPSSGSGGNTTNSASNPAPATDPDRPTLQKHSESTASAADNDGSPVTASNVTDPDRPRLEYGRPKDLESLDAASSVAVAKLNGAPINLEQMVAVSDASNRPPHSYVYSWNDPEDAKKMQTALEGLAQQLLAKSAQTVPSSVTNKTTVTRSATNAHTTATTAHRRVAKPALPVLSDEQFNAYELTFGGGATLVFSAATGEGDAARYITIIAQPDFNGAPLVLFKQITSHRELDFIPRMKLVDAADTDADNRAELIFALENTAGRQYAIYRVVNNHVEQVFTTGS